MRFFAHSGTKSDRSDWQGLEDHLAAVEHRAGDRGRLVGLSTAAGVAGRFHDLGKYSPEFDRVLRGEPGARVDHSTAGGRVLREEAPDGMVPVADLLAYAILGHHAGLPDRSGADGGCFDQRIARPGAVLDPAWQGQLPVDFAAIGSEFMRRIRRDRDKAGFDLSVAVRMMFSCLVDADFRDTEAFYAQLEGRTRDRDWPGLNESLPELQRRFAAHMAGFCGQSDLNRLRAEILAHVRTRSDEEPGLFTLSVPTGGGKTLASLGFALDHAARHGHRRIIYAIPFTSIIDQTAAVFREVLGAGIVLEHHGAIETEKGGEEGRDKARLAMEDWAAPVVVTTNVQLFESLFAARTSRCRKLHNIAGSVIVLDEVQTLPRPLLLPTLAMIDTLATHYGCTVVLCTATQPAFDSRQLRSGGLPLAGRELAPDPQALATALRRVRIVDGGVMGDDALVAALGATEQGFVIVNSRKHALALYRAAAAAGLDGLVHLTTRQYPAHRRRIIAEVRDRLKHEAPCRLIATSLIEAGVDLDFPLGWRAEAGLDSVIQAAGRVNREGKRPAANSALMVFSAPENPPPPEVANLAQAMRATAKRFDDLLAPEAIRHWFDEVYWRAGAERLDTHGLLAKFGFDGRRSDFSFREVAAKYKVIEDRMVPVIVATEPKALAEVNKLWAAQVPSGAIARALQVYTVQIPAPTREVLRVNGKGDFVAQDVRGDQFFVLSDDSLYHEGFGLWWEQAEFLGADQGIV